MRFCGGCGRPLERGLDAVAQAPSHEGPQRRHVTVMFCDLVDSTPLAELLDPEDFREVLTDYRQVGSRAIERFGGYTAVYAGDGMTVYFGYPRAHEDDARRCVHAGLAILDELAELNARLMDLYDVSIQIRIGVHSGVVIAEELGGGAGETRSQLDVTGEMPHIASRLESIAPPGSIVISDATRDLVQGYFVTEPLGERLLKGVSRPIGVHRVLRPTGAVGRLEVARTRRLTPVVGRGPELERLTEAWREVARGEGALAHVTGEAGIGKSRLVHELIEMLGQTGAVQTWQCSPHHQSTALYPVITFLERLPGLSRANTDEQRLEALRRYVVDAELDPAEGVPLLADLLSIRGSGHGGRDVLTPRDARTALLHTLESLLVTNPARHPALLVVDDLHWADPTTVELLSRIIRSLPHMAVFCVLTFRSGLETPWPPPVLEIELRRLTSAEVRAMAAAAADQPLEATVLEWLDAGADGVPLFVEEMLKVGPAPQASVVPPTLEGLLTERLDRLPDLTDVIDAAAILGREFDQALLAALDPLGGGELEPALVRLAAQDVIRPVIGAPGRFEFTHGLLQEAAYARILRRRRRALHDRVAETLIRRFPDVVAREPEIVAHHWAAADEPEQALLFWHAAGTRAIERAAYLEAAEHFRRGLEALEEAGRHRADGLQHVDFLTHIAASLQAGRGYAAEGVGETYERARKALERLRDDARLVSVIRGQWMFHLLRGEYSTALDLADDMLALGQRDGRRKAFAEGHLHRGLAHMYLGNFDLAREHLEEAFVHYRAPDVSDHIYEAQGDTGVGALAYLALVLWNLGHARESLERSGLSLERAEHVGGPVTRAQAWGMRSILHLSRSEAVELAQWVQKTHAHSVDHDLGYWRTVSSLLAGWLQGRAGELELGMSRVQQCLDAYIASGSRLGLPHFHILLADLRRAAGDKPGALELLRAGEEYMEATGERFSESELFRFKGRLHMIGDDPDPDSATAALGRAIQAAQEQNAKLLELQAATRLAEHQRRIGEPCTALERIATLCDWFEPNLQLQDIARARTLLASETMTR
ncbi:MAG TPA: adenylate/guanylate cyclase domain-containing protein [Thermoleophilaceae bacterium]|nr:adenylate/guanylate cyclase domain-containing protein [Thermoleophilaceae bacterium]